MQGNYWSGVAAGLMAVALAVGAAACGAATPVATGKPSASISGPRSTDASGTPGPSRAYGANCRLSQLRIGRGLNASESTEEETLIFTLRNVSSSGCDLRGYPRVTLFDLGGHRLGFTYLRRGDQMLTSTKPVLVPVAPGAIAYIAVNKSSCVAHASSTARRAEIGLGSARMNLTIALPWGRTFDYCTVGDPGHTVDVAPFESSQTALYASR